MKEKSEFVEANYDRRWWWASWMGLAKEKI